MSTIKVNTVTKRTGSTLTLGESGTTVTLACGATQTGFGRTGTVDWCTTAKTSPFTAVSGDGFFVNTTGGTITVTLPASPSPGDIVALADYANQWATNNVTICRNSSLINGGAFNATLSTNGQSVTLVYVDGTKGWKTVTDSTANVTGAPNFISATGGSITTCGDFKIHTFTSDGTFTICSAPTPANNNVSYLVVAGGGAGANDEVAGGGGGAGKNVGTKGLAGSHFSNSSYHQKGGDGNNGTFTSGGGGGFIYTNRYGGNGGGPGAAGAAGTGTLNMSGSDNGAGGGKGNYITGNSFATWSATGTRGGNVA